VLGGRGIEPAREGQEESQEEASKPGAIISLCLPPIHSRARSSLAHPSSILPTPPTALAPSSCPPQLTWSPLPRRANPRPPMPRGLVTAGTSKPRGLTPWTTCGAPMAGAWRPSSSTRLITTCSGPELRRAGRQQRKRSASSQAGAAAVELAVDAKLPDSLDTPLHTHFRPITWSRHLMRHLIHASDG
jgi:hypothetical protein